jgi:uncharacterized coiled-coil DUF342 family protein
MSETKALKDCIDYYRYEWLSIKDQEHHEEVADLASAELDELEKDNKFFSTVSVEWRNRAEKADEQIAQLRADVERLNGIITQLRAEAKNSRDWEKSNHGKRMV